MINSYFIGTLLNLACLYMIAGTGALISIKAGFLNLGGEGQIYLGGFVCAVLLASPGFTSLPAFLAVPAAFVLAMAASGLISLLSGFLAYRKQADTLFTTFLISAAVIPLVDGLISGPCRGKTGNLLATPFLMPKFRIPSLLKPSPLNASFGFAILLCLLFWYVLNRTKAGRQLCIFGTSSKFAVYAGYNAKNIIYASAFGSGALHGLCGAIAVVGTYYTCHVGFYSSMGWNGFSAALIASGNPILLIPSSLVLATLIHSSDTYAIFHNFGFDMGSIIQAVILFLIASLRRKKNDS